MPPRSPVQSGESKKDGAWQKYRIGKSNKRRESTVEDKAHHAALDCVHIQIISIESAESSRAHHATLERDLIQRIIIQAEESSIVHHAALEHVCIWHWLFYRWSITTYYVTFICWLGYISWLPTYLPMTNITKEAKI